METVKKIINALNWIGGLRDESNMFATCDPVEAAAWEGITGDIPAMA